MGDRAILQVFSPQILAVELTVLFIQCYLFLLWLCGTGPLTQPLGKEAPNGALFKGSRMMWEGSKHIASYLPNILPLAPMHLPGRAQLAAPMSFKTLFFASFLPVFIQ